MFHYYTLFSEVFDDELFEKNQKVTKKSWIEQDATHSTLRD